MSSTNKTPKYGLNQWLGTDYLKRDDLNNDNMIIENKFGTIDNTLTTHTNAINDLVYPTAGGTATALTVPMQTLGQGYAKTFIAAYNNGGAATTINGKPLYKPGTTTPPTITAGKACTVWYNAAGGCFFSKASASGNTIAAHVLANDIFSNDIDTDLIGTMPNNGALNITPGAAAKTIPLGYTSGGTVAGDQNLISSNILAGKSIFGIQGKSSVVDTSDALATAAQLLSGVTAYVNGVKITGTIPSKAATSYTPGTTNQTIAIGQYISGIQTILGDANLIAANIKSGASIFGVNGKASVTDTADGTATAAQLLSGFTAYVNGTKVNGSIPSKAATTYIPGTTDQTIAAGQYISDLQTIQGDADLVSANIKAGASIFGVNGKASVVDTSDATAAAADLLSGKTVYVNGSKVTGAIPSKAAATITPGTTNQTIANGQYLSGPQTILGDPNLNPKNIVKGKNIFGVTGSGGYVVGDVLVNQEVEHVMENAWSLGVGLARTGTSSLCYLNGYLYCWGGSNDGIFSRADKNGNLVNTFNGYTSYSSAIAPTSSGDIFAILRGNGGSSYAYRKSLTGTTIWQSNLSSAGMTHVGTDDSNFYCASQSNSVTYITKFNGSGGVVWSKALLSTQADGVYYKNGYLYAITFGGNLYKITTDGTVVWYVGIGSPVHDLAIDEQDNVWVTFNTSVAKVSSNGVKLFSVNNQSTPYSVVTDKLNYLYVGSANSITCCNSDGVVMWSKAISNNPYGLAVDDEYNVYYIMANDSGLNKLKQYYKVVR